MEELDMGSRLDGNGAKYKKIYRELREGLTSGRYLPGEKLPTEIELVEQFSASRPTVGRALSKLESEGLVQRRAGSGTFVSSKEAPESHVFGLLIPELGQTEIFEPICQGMSGARLGSRHELLWGNTASNGATKELQAEQLCENYLKRPVSGVFFAPLELTGGKDEVNFRIVHALDEAHIPIVLLDRDIYEYPKRSSYDLVGIDNRRAGFTITEHLLGLGCKRIVFFARPNSAPTVNARAWGYRDAIATHLKNGAVDLVEFGDPTDLAKLQEILSRLRPEAFACANDYTAAQLMTSLTSLGVNIPSEIRIVGIDDVKYASLLQVPLTTIHQPCQDIGATALLAMLDRIAHPSTPARDFLLDFQLVIRQSSRINSGDSKSNELG
jgi:GntR family transcriptional regulator of arabinose operon